MTDKFSSRWGLLAATLGMAVGAGNIWRFPRVAAAQGGGAFVFAWMVALVVWSLPLLLLEYRWGSSASGGSPLKVFSRKVGKPWVVAGGFVAVCCCAIMCYYSVVTGWCLLYLLQGAWLPSDREALQAWWNSTEGSLLSAAAAFTALVLAAIVVARGVRSGIERVSRIMVPALFVLLCLAAIRAIMMPGAEAGISFLFRFEAARLADYRIWLEAFSQSAWSTGAGWGLMLVYAGYDRDNRYAISNSLVTGFGNNLASILAAMAVLSTLFAMLGRQEALSTAAAGNQGLAFVWLPSLFLDMKEGGRLLLMIFLAALVLASISSLIAMMELAASVAMDLGMERRRGVWAAVFLATPLAVTSALWPDFFKNQDWVWGLGLLVSGGLFAAGALKTGVVVLARGLFGNGRGIARAGRAWFSASLAVSVPIACVAMLTWWLLSVGFGSANWYTPFSVSTPATCAVQWILVMVLLVVFRKKMLEKITKSDS